MNNKQLFKDKYSCILADLLYKKGLLNLLLCMDEKLLVSTAWLLLATACVITLILEAF
jgi:hypothetical protein